MENLDCHFFYDSQESVYLYLFIFFFFHSKDSFEHLSTWLEDVKYNSGVDTVITVVGNKGK